MSESINMDTPLYEIIAPQIANYCWRAFEIRTLGEFAARIEEKKIIKVPGVPWLFRFSDESFTPRMRRGKGGNLGIGKGSWESLFNHLDTLGFDWRKHIVNRATYRPL